MTTRRGTHSALVLASLATLAAVPACSSDAGGSSGAAASGSTLDDSAASKLTSAPSVWPPG